MKRQPTIIRHDQLRQLPPEERRQKAARILALGLLKLLNHEVAAHGQST